MHRRTYGSRETLAHCLLACAAGLLLVACGGGGSGGSDPASNSENRLPQIAGIPGASVPAGQAYGFQPSALDEDGDDLVFSIANSPDWATFDAATGQLTGTPTAADVGTYSNVLIRVSDGIATTALASFSIAVTQLSMGSATVSWLPPTENTDGTALTDLAGFRIRYGTSAAALDQQVTLDNPGLTRYLLEDLASGTWYFTVRAYASDGAESGPSNIASKSIG